VDDIASCQLSQELLEVKILSSSVGYPLLCGPKKAIEAKTKNLWIKKKYPPQN